MKSLVSLNSNAAVCCHLHWCSCSHPNDWTANGCFLVYLWRHDRLSTACRCFVFYWLEGNLTNFRCLHSPTAIAGYSLPGCRFLFNILGEGCFGGYIFPRQELAFKQYTWFVHGCCWWTFHIRLKCATNDPHFITSFVVQKTKHW